jgi:RHS repeat-associated protein
LLRNKYPLERLRQSRVYHLRHYQVIFGYDGMQNRISKAVRTLTDTVFTFYVRDAQGNVLGIYTRTTAATPTITWTEQYLYGSGRLGSVQPGLSWTAASTYTGPHFAATRRLLQGQKRYEISNHLGNVLTTVGDRRVPVDGAVVDNIAEYYTATLFSAQDYYPFGMEMPGRTFVLPGMQGSRLGFNGQEASDLGSGQLTARYWEYDARLGRRWNLDPLMQITISDYATFRNNPLYFNDVKGDCPNCVTAAIGAGVGALFGGGFEIASQLYNNGSVTNWTAVGGSAVQGAIVGGAAGLTGGASLLTTSVAMGGANAVGGAINNRIQDKPITVQSVTTDAMIGLAAGVAGKLVSKVVKFKGGGRINTTGKQHGTETHWNTMIKAAEKLADEGAEVTLNRQINATLGKIIPGVGKWRPDILSVSKNGSIEIIEVISPTQTAQQMWDKVATMAAALEKEGYKVATKVITESGKVVPKP